MKLWLEIVFFWTIFWEIYGSSLDSDLLGCSKNMIRYLVNENSTEIFCDCQDTFWYNPEDDNCYDGYRQGPCPSGEYFVLSPGESTAKCEKNPCHIDGLVPFERGCYQLWDYGHPCGTYNPLGIIDNIQIACSNRSYVGDCWNLTLSKDCPENSFLKPTNRSHKDYVCQCEYTYLYSRKDNSCYQAYRQGPCAPGNYFVRPLGETKPRCEKNPCQEDGLVPFQDGCHKIYKVGPPCKNVYTSLTVNITTFQLECSYRVYSRQCTAPGGIIGAPQKACPPGSRRIVTGCKKKFD